MAKTPDELFAFLEGLGVAATTTSHPALHTVAESQALRSTIPGAHTKNLFLKDRKDRFFLLTVEENAEIDLKTVHQIIGASGKVSFGKPEMLMELLGVAPGSVTVLGLVNDEAGRVTAILDAKLMRHDLINVHPLTNEATTTLDRDDLIRFVEATGHEAVILNVAA